MKKTIYAASILVLCAILIFSIFNVVKIVNNKADITENSDYVSRIIERDGVEYYPRQDITTFLLVGLDRAGPVQESDSYNNSAKADVVMVITLDNTKKELNVLNLNRDSILPVQVLSVAGYPAGTVDTQLALAHTYGKGVKDSAENTVQTVSSYLYGLKIDHYLTVGMDCIETINDSLGGVRVTVTDDFSRTDTFIPKGEVLLSGKQAVTYVRHRETIGDGLNSSRMNRQSEYFKGLFEAIRDNNSNDNELLLQVFESLSDRMVTNCSAQTLSDILNKFSEYKLGSIITPAGENVMGEEFMEFHIDNSSIDKIILDFFYSVK